MSRIDPSDRMEEAVDLAHQGQYAEALELFLWCFDHGVEHRPAFSGVRRSFLLGYMAELGRTFPPAMEALEQRREAAEQIVLSDEGTFQSAHDLVALNRTLGTPDRSLAFFDRLGEVGERQRETQKQMLSLVLDQLVEHRRYNSIVEVQGDVEEKVEMLIDSYQRCQEFHGDPEATDSLKTHVLRKAGQFYEALLGVEDEAGAEGISEKLLAAFSAEPMTYITLSQHAARTGRVGTAESLLERGLKEVPAEDCPDLQRVLEELARDDFEE